MLVDQYIVRDARAEDVSQLSVLITQLGYPCTAEEVQTRFDNVSQNPDYRTMVITDSDTVIGMAGLVKGFWYEKNGTYVRILAFVINDQYRGRGVGKQLIKVVEDWATELGCNSVILSSGNRDERIGAHHFYKGLGYEIKSSGFIKQL
jgi:GNAT superfamily N-acetyltransferase